MRTEEPTLATLIQRIAARDVAAFESLYRATHKRLFSAAILTGGDRAQAEDVLQEAFLRVWHSAGSFDAERATPMTWLISIVRNKAIDVVRSRHAERRVTGKLDDEAFAVAAEASSEPPQIASRANAARALNTRLAQMRGVQRQALTMAYGRGLHHHEIATALGAPLGTAKAWVRRGTQTLRGELLLAGIHAA